MASGRRVKVVFNPVTDVVSVFYVGSRADFVRHAPADKHILVELDSTGDVVGIELLGASTLVQARWPEHPDRARMPAEILNELDRWLAHRWADSK